jgi:hypothetical protein
MDPMKPFALIMSILLTVSPLLAESSAPAASAVPASTRLAVQGTCFTLNGVPTFLYGLSMYGALGEPDQLLLADLDRAAKSLSVNWIRVWATWSGFDNDISAVNPDGSPREPFLAKLRWLVAECDRRGIVVDVTLSRGTGVAGKAPIEELPAHRKAVETIIAALKDRGNWYLDLGNERNIRDKRFTSIDDLKALRLRARELSPALLVTASDGGDIDPDELGHYLLDVGTDFVCPHRPRDAKSPAQTEAKTREYLDRMKALGRVVPVHYQEPFRRGYADWDPAAADFVADAKAARDGGAAGWCFHNGGSRTTPDGRPRRSFDLRDASLFAQLDPEEQKALDQLATLFKSPPR